LGATQCMSMSKRLYRRHRFPPDIIAYAVWLYFRFSLTFREIEELVAERGITVSYETIRQCCLKFGPRYAKWLRQRERSMRRFKSITQAQRCLSVHGLVQNLFRVRRRRCAWKQRYQSARRL